MYDYGPKHLSCGPVMCADLQARCSLSKLPVVLKVRCHIMCTYVLAPGPGPRLSSKDCHRLTCMRSMCSVNISVSPTAVCTRAPSLHAQVYFLAKVPENVMHMVVRELVIHQSLSHKNIIMLYGVFQVGVQRVGPSCRWPLPAGYIQLCTVCMYKEAWARLIRACVCRLRTGSTHTSRPDYTQTVKLSSFCSVCVA